MIIDSRDGLYNQMKDNEALLSAKFPMWILKLQDLQKGYEMQEDEMMVKILDDIMVDAWIYINDIRPDLGFKVPQK